LYLFDPANRDQGQPSSRLAAAKGMARGAAVDAAATEEAFRQANSACIRCDEKYRDVPSQTLIAPGAESA
jgi:hypothetical protein